MSLLIPRDLSTLGAASGFLAKLPAYLDDVGAVLDFSALTFAKPFATLLLANGIRDFVSVRSSLGLETHVATRGLFVGDRESAISYLGHVGFFEYVGIPYGNALGQAQGGPTYLPLTEVTRDQLAASAGSGVLQEAVNAKCKHLAAMIFDDESQQDQLAYCLREIVRNVFEHAQTDRCTVMAQKYRSDQVELAIADRGCGVQASLGAAYLDRSPSEALSDAIKPGVTRVAGEQSAGRWDNTGFGLYVCSELGKETGSFTIASSRHFLSLKGAGRSVGTTPVVGTAIRLVVSASEAEFFPNRLHQIVERGEREAGMSVAAVRSASQGTRMSKRG
jgi:hypothetical protein